MDEVESTSSAFSDFGVTDTTTRTYITDKLGTNSDKAIITLDKDTLKLTKKNIQEDYVNSAINDPYNPNIGVLTLASLDRVALVFTYRDNSGMDLNVDLLSSIN